RGYDEAPFPLAFMGAGMVASYFTEIAALAQRRGVALDGLRLVLDNRYTMEGSALRGTMTGGALPPVLTVEIDGEAGDADLPSLCADALSASPLHGLLRERLT
ncbi:MAG: OsmC family peroxiredoxin, partial [Gammaproteobacteria bacterium]|nr:OsmC family peroxiredoxin [Gemmatimonadota bacterium]NIR36828.1 OsmC family peroxiredoxin [Actinomycetota bacterium]NIU74742.1 OsmC family peroxiredoxin [Gammaproteobacteria bacterium]